ncbi:MAG: hypothetical protein AAGI01_13195 [Myxococcota bacterium]
MSALLMSPSLVLFAGLAVAPCASSCAPYTFAAPAERAAASTQDSSSLVYLATVSAPATHQLPLSSLTLALADQLQQCGVYAAPWDAAPGRVSEPIVRCAAQRLVTRGMGDLLVTEARISCILTHEARSETVTRTGRAELVRDPASTTIALTREVETLAMLRALEKLACPVRAALDP